MNIAPGLHIYFPFCNVDTSTAITITCGQKFLYPGSLSGGPPNFFVDSHQPQKRSPKSPQAENIAGFFVKKSGIIGNF